MQVSYRRLWPMRGAPPSYSSRTRPVGGSTRRFAGGVFAVLNRMLNSVLLRVGFLSPASEYVGAMDRKETIEIVRAINKLVRAVFIIFPGLIGEQVVECDRETKMNSMQQQCVHWSTLNDDNFGFCDARHNRAQSFRGPGRPGRKSDRQSREHEIQDAS